MKHLSSHGSPVRSPHSSTDRSLYQRVTTTILEALQCGVVPWRKPWADSALPCNAISKRPYRGVNVILLSLSRYRDHRWLTFRQAQELGGFVRAGEHSTTAVFWKRWDLVQTDHQTGDAKRQSIPLLRLYHVFNAEQCQDIKIQPLAANGSIHPNQRIELAESMVRLMPHPPIIREGGGRASYCPPHDLVQIPRIETFKTPDAYYATLLHELGHATGHEQRLNRPAVTGKSEFGSCEYSREELVAELTSAFCCAAIGLDNSLIGDSASYIEGWLRSLQGDPKAVVLASAQAQRAADYIQNLHIPVE